MAVTVARVRCSAWLGARVDSRETWKKSLETLALTGDDPTTGDENVERRSCMEVRRDEKRRCVETRGRPKSQTVAGAAAWLNREGKKPSLEQIWNEKLGTELTLATREQTF